MPYRLGGPTATQLLSGGRRFLQTFVALSIGGP